MPHSESVVQSGEPRCYLCGSRIWLERHHIYAGSRRKWSEAFGLWVWLCNRCHTGGPNAAQYNNDVGLKLKKEGQRIFEQNHTRNEFRRYFGKSYL